MGDLKVIYFHSRTITGRDSLTLDPLILVDQSEASIDQSEALEACFVREGINNEQNWTKFARTPSENSNFPLTRVVQLVVPVQKTLAGRKVF